MRRYTKKDFEIKGRRTGSQLRGRENEFIYEVFWNGKQVTDVRFTTKSHADKYVSKLVKLANMIAEGKHEF